MSRRGSPNGYDWTAKHRMLSAILRRGPEAATGPMVQDEGFGQWRASWFQQLEREPTKPAVLADVLDQRNPIYIPRNHRVEEALDAAISGNLQPFERLLEAVVRPFESRPGFEDHAEPAPADFGPYRTFCGT